MRQVQTRNISGAAAPPARDVVVAPPAEERLKSLLDYFNIVRRHLPGILSLTLAGLLVGFVKASLELPLYRASVTMVIEPENAGTPGLQMTAYPVDLWRYYETQYELLKSRAVAAKAVDKLGLLQRPVPVGDQRQGETAGGWLRWTGIELPWQRRAAETAMVPPDVAEAARRDQMIGMIQGGVAVKGTEKSRIVVVSYDSGSPVLAAEYANAVVDAYIETVLESRVGQVRQTSAWLFEQIEDLRKKVLSSEERLQNFQSREQLVDTKSLEQLSSSRLGILNQDVVNAQSKYAEMAKRYGPKHPQIIAARTEIDAAKRRLEEASRTAVSTRGKEFELAKYEREVATNRQLYETFLGKFKESDLSANYRLSNVQVVDRARAPEAPFKPDRRQIMVLWGMLGFIGGLAFAFLRERLDNTFKGTAQTEDILNLPVLGSVPLVMKKGRSDALVPERHYLREMRSAFAESINHIRTGITYSNVDNPPKVILISSAAQGEGKTTLASNLALAFAQTGRTLLIDADLRKPRASKVVKGGVKEGLVEYVAGTRTLQDCITGDTECRDLFILRSGTVPPNPLELLSSKKFRHALSELRNAFAHIVVDTAPILPVSDAIVLSHTVDALLLVIQADKTTHSMAAEVLRRLDGANIKPLGVALTKVNVGRSSYYYDSKYGYSGYYGAYYGAKR